VFLLGLDLGGLSAFLSGANFSGADIGGANFSGAQLDGSNFGHTYLFLVMFSRSNLHSANFDHSLIINTFFDNSDLRIADFSDSILGGSDFSKANLTGANLTRTKFDDSVGFDKVIMEYGYITSDQEKDLPILNGYKFKFIVNENGKKQYVDDYRSGIKGYLIKLVKITDLNNEMD
jgi:hypothetical protein